MRALKPFGLKPTTNHIKFEALKKSMITVPQSKAIKGGDGEDDPDEFVIIETIIDL